MSRINVVVHVGLYLCLRECKHKSKNPIQLCNVMFSIPCPACRILQLMLKWMCDEMEEVMRNTGKHKTTDMKHKRKKETYRKSLGLSQKPDHKDPKVHILSAEFFFLKGCQ